MSKDEDPERTVFRPAGATPPPSGWRTDGAGKPGAGWGPARAPVGPRRTPAWEEVSPPETEPGPPSPPRRKLSPRLAMLGVGLVILALAAAGLIIAREPAGDARKPPAMTGPEVEVATAAPVATVATAPAQPGEPPLPPAEAPPPPGSFAFPGAPAEAYARLVQPACQAAIEDRYPFFGNAARDAAPGEVRRLFGPGGMLPSFVAGKLAPLIATDGPVWRWRPGGAAAEFDPATPELLARLPALTGLIGEGLDFEVEPVAFGGGVTAVELGLPGSRQRFDGPGPPRRAQWRLPARPADSSLVLIRDGRPVRRYQEGGFWSPFRLIDKGRSIAEPGGATLVTFSDGSHSATLRLRPSGGGQPFGRGGLWAFRCPAKL